MIVWTFDGSLIRFMLENWFGWQCHYYLHFSVLMTLLLVKLSSCLVFFLHFFRKITFEIYDVTYSTWDKKVMVALPVTQPIV